MSVDEATVKAKTVPQLKALLSAAGLPVTGNKPGALLSIKGSERLRLLNLAADLVARVLENPHVLTEGDAAPSTTKSTDPSSTTSAAAPVTADASASASTTTSAAPAAATSVDEELERRKKRAERFGVAVETPAPAAATDDGKKSERAKRFGTTAPADTSAKVCLPAVIGHTRG
jgi:hypothetical protein